ncbi:hypothetical protein [Terasakiella pusilla]|uniref:hypothetical protein n=1 Tax=Terasakiella pusilla TaxID=64973 RepID=UPI003AA9678D
MTQRKAVVLIVFMLAACEMRAEPGQTAKMCKEIGGEDQFIIDPNHERTTFSVGPNGTYSYFVDRLTGQYRTLSQEQSTRYACEDVEG